MIKTNIESVGWIVWGFTDWHTHGFLYPSKYYPVRLILWFRDASEINAQNHDFVQFLICIFSVSTSHSAIFVGKAGRDMILYYVIMLTNCCIFPKLT